MSRILSDSTIEAIRSRSRRARDTMEPGRHRLGRRSPREENCVVYFLQFLFFLEGGPSSKLEQFITLGSALHHIFPVRTASFAGNDRQLRLSGGFCGAEYEQPRLRRVQRDL